MEQQINISNEKVTTMEGIDTADNIQYIDAIKQLKDTTVSRGEYDKVIEENKKLLKSLVNGEALDLGKASADRTREELDKALFGSSNYQTCKAMVELRDKIREEDGIDNVFNARGPYANTTPESEDRNEQVYDGLKSLLEEANGDEDYFNVLYQRYTK